MTGKRDDSSEDMTMEEILASIRKYVTDDGGEESQAIPNPHSGSVVVPPPGAAFEGAKEEVLDLTEPVEAPNQNIPQPQPAHGAAQQAAAPQQRPQAGAPTHGTTAAASALSQLSQVAQNNPTPSPQVGTHLTVDQLIQDLATPMIQGWLNQHLPRLVEELVAREIDRIRRAS